MTADNRIESGQLPEYEYSGPYRRVHIPGVAESDQCGPHHPEGFPQITQSKEAGIIR